MEEVRVEIGKHIAIDGRTQRLSYEKKAGQNSLHLVSARAWEARLTLGQIAAEETANEITAIPLLLELLDLIGTTVTIDAMGCQKVIAAKVIEEESDYLLASKDYCPSLCQDVEGEFSAAVEVGIRPRGMRRQMSMATNRGRGAHREYFSMPAPDTWWWFSDWADLSTTITVVRTRLINEQEAREAGSFLSNLQAMIKSLAKLIRQH